VLGYPESTKNVCRRSDVAADRSYRLEFAWTASFRYPSGGRASRKAALLAAPKAASWHRRRPVRDTGPPGTAVSDLYYPERSPRGAPSWVFAASPRIELRSGGGGDDAQTVCHAPPEVCHGARRSGFSALPRMGAVLAAVSRDPTASC
jgi:hypothetical protein